MQSPKISRVTKPHQSNKQSSLQQSQRCLKKTLVKKLWEYNIKCGSDVYLVIVDHMGDDVVQFFTTKFMVDQQLTEGFPPSEKSLESAQDLQNMAVTANPANQSMQGPRDPLFRTPSQCNLKGRQTTQLLISDKDPD
uniref:Uncharacterized protein n=1 Tax=Coccidioides posadasii RMSCC 3488 TaxID=454284 RepID=A0A0J6FH81_COCPO|nr:hypothetical protein CPAG_05024 [Coccidioides posadasii RMSCC 3488]